MNEITSAPAAAPGPAAGLPDDIARRVVTRCRQLGLGQDEAAARAGMSPRYLGQLLDFGPGFDPGAVFRLARVLGMSRADLVEGRTDAPPGGPRAAPRPRLLRLTEQECWARLGTHGVGRIALPGERFPLVLPVNYTVDGTTVAYRTSDFGAPAAAAGDDVAFEVDRIDDRRSSGWSVLLGGRAERVRDPEEERRLVGLAAAEPWAGGHRTLWIRIVPETVTGRVVGPAGDADGGGGP
ncbi:helix-turn-helix domain-containing protein [Kitasatospora sp. DSM 101779]|uniref:helix-turn-helix domain-containing protein n=1 Tax=Kitasatospora sp. DSM 101779 TaxID=2853165 RepID=UPI0021D85E57|nr:pyridoxamine 5'-phosphate oxidase family protein [Kitasatospora sp. DSM 101779]MCU7826259.1 pyridoxamine 5'-phosphate oxidase family protein [Kitasatospora sp. DSM 101779]